MQYGEMVSMRRAGTQPVTQGRPDEFSVALGELLAHIGLDAGPLNGGPISISVDEKHHVHFGPVDNHRWFMLAEIGSCICSGGEKRYAELLRFNSLTQKANCPVIAIDGDDRIVCWVCMSYSDPSSAVFEAFDTLLDTAEHFGDPSLFGGSEL